MKELHEVIDGLEDGRWYIVYGSLEDANEGAHTWWAAWWEESTETFWTGTGDAIFMDDLRILPDPLHEVEE